MSFEPCTTSAVYKRLPMIPGLLLLLLSQSTMAQTEPRHFHIEIGPFALDQQLPPRWKSAEDPSEVQPILDREGIQWHPEFVLRSEGGALIFAVHAEFERLALSPREIAETPLPRSTLKAWGLSEEQIQNEVEVLPSGLEIAQMTATGRGSGRELTSGGPVQTLAKWIYAPYFYRDSDQIKSVMLTLFYRSSETEAASGGLELFHDLVDSLRSIDEVAPATAREFRDFLARPEDAAGAAPEVAVEGGADSRATSSEEPLSANRASGESASREQEAPDVTTVDADTLGSWAHAAFSSSLEQQVDALRRLTVRFPANPYLRAELERLEPILAERKRIRDLLEADSTGNLRKELQRLHESILDRLARGKKPKERRAEVQAYRVYLELVWPGNPITGRGP